MNHHRRTEKKKLTPKKNCPSQPAGILISRPFLCIHFLSPRIKKEKRINIIQQGGRGTGIPKLVDFHEDAETALPFHLAFFAFVAVAIRTAGAASVATPTVAG
jgi:hypothetical protein